VASQNVRANERWWSKDRYLETLRSHRVIPVSVVIPAHDEANVIDRCLQTLQAGAEPGELELVIVCNGCSDDTADLARAAAPSATIVELPVASKAAALNEGERHVTRFPRFYVDADVELGAAAIRSTAAALQEGVLCAAPTVSFDLTSCPWYVRSFYSVLREMPFLSGPGAVGTGVYALSEEGRRRFDSFPAITADDQFVMERFAASERRAVPSASFVVHPPRTLAGLVAIRTRTYRGNRELGSFCQPVEPSRHSNARALLRLSLRPRAVVGVAVYVAVNMYAKYRATRSWDGRWERDVSARPAVS
jgi:glycosyltransferase involved in cell wall biosynthesis